MLQGGKTLLSSAYRSIAAHLIAKGMPGIGSSSKRHKNLLAAEINMNPIDLLQLAGGKER